MATDSAISLETEPLTGAAKADEAGCCDGFKDFCCSFKGCCSCCCCLILSIVTFIVWFLSGAKGARYVPLGANTVTVGFGSDMISLLFGKGVPGYASSWCPDGLATCDTRVDFPGPDTTSYMRWDDVWEMGSRYPAREWAGEIWRGNELGFIINVPLFWSNVGLSPQSIALGITPKQHAAVRPTMEEMWYIDEKGKSKKHNHAHAIVTRRIRDFLKKDAISLPTDTTILVHQILNEVGLQRNISWGDAAEFVGVQGQVVAFGTLGQLVPGFMYDTVMGGAAEGAQGYIAEYGKLMEKLFGDRLKSQDCSPSDNCTAQAAGATWDALYAAGGLSVPGTINTGLGIMYSTDGSNPAPGASYERPGQAAQFYWENVRFFPPVVGFPHWKKPPTCAGSAPGATAALLKPDGESEPCTLGADKSTGYPAVNQYVGGVREVPNLALAMSDPRKWGEDSDQFKLRSLEEYQANSVGFAEMAVDHNVSEGRMNRVCPGRNLALMIGTTFFEEFDSTQWHTSDSVTFKATTPFVGGFTLKKATSLAPSSLAPSRMLLCGIAFFTAVLHAHD